MFSTVKARTNGTRGASFREAGLVLAVKVLLAAEKRWGRVNGSHLVALVGPDVDFPNVEAEMFQSEPAPAHLFTHTPSVFAAGEMAIRKI